MHAMHKDHPCHASAGADDRGNHDTRGSRIAGVRIGNEPTHVGQA
jgi:hypothetical protein